MNKKKFLMTFLSLCLFSTTNCMSATKEETLNRVDLSGAAIDLLVGTPDGVIEPLDQRRTKPAKEEKHDFSEYLGYDEEVENSISPEISWEDAEEEKLPTDSEESTYLDLISEVDELEGQNFEEVDTSLDGNLSDSVETGIKL